MSSSTFSWKCYYDVQVLGSSTKADLSYTVTELFPRSRREACDMEEGGRRIVFFLLPRMGMTFGNVKQEEIAFCPLLPFH